ncbi:carotenoid biosynthesis protein [Mangrovibacterium sp.]|uniref:carotenoid biosynthesis protein n=1 Tax=Mangrovibacterium sp. TaxID=1961364 RepID=UPI00356274B7
MNTSTQSVFYARMILALLYLVGCVGFTIPATEPLFSLLSPFNLLLSGMVLFLFQEKWTAGLVLALPLVALIGFGAELLGTQTGLLFGNYSYGPVLGLKLWDTPLLIGLNWLVLSFGIYTGLRRLPLGWWLPPLGALLMVAFDYVMEPVAVRLDMWSWQGNVIPLKNYIDWFLLSFVLFAGMKLFRLNHRNQLAVWIVLCQFVFFLVLNISLNLI